MQGNKRIGVLSDCIFVGIGGYGSHVVLDPQLFMHAEGSPIITRFLIRWHKISFWVLQNVKFVLSLDFPDIFIQVTEILIFVEWTSKNKQN